MHKIGLALGGGGARGLAHIGVLKVLDAENIKVEAITGCSMGAVIGGLYSYFGEAKGVEDFILSMIRNSEFIKMGKLFNENGERPTINYFTKVFNYIGIRFNTLKALNRISYFNDHVYDRIFEKMPNSLLADLKIRFSAIATDLRTGEEINLTEGRLIDVLKASSAIPGIFPPIEYQGHLFIDGSASESVPSGPVREIGAKKVLGIDVMRCIKSTENPKNIFDILYRAEEITSFKLSVLRLEEADFVIRPEVRHLSWADFDKAEEIIRAGESAARNCLNDIKMVFDTPSKPMAI